MTTFSEQFPIVFQALNVGFVQTLKLFFITLIGAIPLGLIISFGSMSAWRPFRVFRSVKWLSEFKLVRAITRLVIWVVRGTPLMLQLLVIYYFPGLVWKNNIWGSGEAGRFVASSVAFVFNYACYFSEIYRGGIQGVPKGQQEAGQVLGMTKSQIFFQVTQGFSFSKIDLGVFFLRWSLQASQLLIFFASLNETIPGAAAPAKAGIAATSASAPPHILHVIPAISPRSFLSLNDAPSIANAGLEWGHARSGKLGACPAASAPHFRLSISAAVNGTLRASVRQRYSFQFPVLNFARSASSFSGRTAQ